MSLRVSLNPARRPLPQGPMVGPMPLLDPAGAAVILGQKPPADGLADPIRPSASALFGPRGAALASPSGPLVVCDTGHHRLLIWSTRSVVDEAPADLVIGQPDFFSEGRNAKGEVGAATLNVPTGVSIGGTILAVADAWNHRVLIWHSLPTRSHQPADVVLGQADFTGGLPNRGSDTASASTLNWCYGVSIVEDALYVADTGNRRVLKWNRIPTTNGVPADLVLGHPDFDTRDENGGHAPDAASMRWPHGIVAWRDLFLVSDAGNNRVMVWTTPPRRNGEPCAFAIGQRDLMSVDHNQAAYYPTATALNMPYGIATHGRQIVIADTASSRLVGVDLDRLAMGAPATSLAGQVAFHDKGDNRWGAVARDSLCWPYGLAVSGTTFAIADSGNNRILLWEAAE